MSEYFRQDFQKTRDSAIRRSFKILDITGIFNQCFNNNPRISFNTIHTWQKSSPSFWFQDEQSCNDAFDFYVKKWAERMDAEENQTVSPESKVSNLEQQIPSHLIGEESKVFVQIDDTSITLKAMLNQPKDGEPDHN